ncbi:MAG: TlpA family protein disulfide reductase, partial [Chitinophagaceae bacterium]|nr:TlpA family protein disulfide reductase [Chitinophagaceae bacterium]
GMNYLKQAALSVKLNNDSSLRPSVVALYQKLNNENKQSRLGQETHYLLFPPLVVQKGEPAADADFTDVQGKHHSLADFRGKYLLVDFWSIGCGPCMMAVPELKELSLGYKEKLEVIGVSIDIKTVWSGLKNKDMIWTNLNDGQENRGIAARYGVDGIPHYALISPDGILLDTWVGYEKGNLIAKIKEHLKS